MPRPFAVAALAAALAACNAAQDRDPRADTVGTGLRDPAKDTARAAAGIDSLEAQLLAAYNRKDAAGIAALYTEDVRFISEGTVENGRTAIEQGWKGSLPDLSGLKLTTLERVVRGDVATVTQRFSQQYKTGVDSGYAVGLLRRDPDGQWRYRTLILSRAPAKQ